MNPLIAVHKLYGGHPVRLEPALCTNSRSRLAGCAACVQACPAGALSSGPDGGPPSLDADRCSGCGLCQAACPTAALAVRDLDAEATLAALGDGPVAAVACRQAGAGDGTPAVPCPGALGPEWLAAAAMGRRLVLQAPDAAGCATCPLQARLAVEAAVAGAALVLRGLGLTGTVELAHGPPAAAAAAARANVVDRRAFLGLARTGLRGMWAAVSRPGDPPPAALPDLPADLPQARRALLAALRRSPAARDLPGSAPAAGLRFARLAAADGCTGCEACTRACPTGALALVESGGALELAVRADACTACGVCAAVCPHGLLRLEPAFSPRDVASGQAQVLARAALARCRRCGRPVAAAAGGGSDTCADCRGQSLVSRFLLGR